MKRVVLGACLFCGLGACGDFSGGDSGSGSYGAPVEITVRNLSQFTLSHVFVHRPEQPFRESGSKVDAPVAPNGEAKVTLSRGPYLVTVTRQKSESGPLRAYTTTAAMELEEGAVVEYYDTQFRYRRKP